MSLLARRCLDRSHQLEGYVETWQIDHKEAMQVCDLEELVKECLELAPLLRRAWGGATDVSFDENVKNESLFVGEELIRVAINRAALAFRKISRLIETSEQAGYAIANAEKFRDAVRDMEALEKEAENECAPLNTQQMDEALADYKRGDFKLAGDMLRELQGSGASSD
ncbi:MAG TPA: hypothetical protein DDY78_05175 [Planctomycetales bacterium]|nr:hypothetical protein [Planctomycetales bacterium]